MCKRNELFGSAVMACGAGLLLALLFSTDFLQAVLGIVLMGLGLCVTCRCR